jgi:hypothetical protein
MALEVDYDLAEKLVGFDWKPATASDIESVPARVLEFVLEIKRGMRAREDAESKQQQTVGQRLTGYGPEDDAPKP